VLSALTELHAAGMLSTTDGGAICRHDTIREAVLERTPTAPRILLHRRAVRVIGKEAMKEGGVALLWEAVHHAHIARTPKDGVRFSLLLSRRLLALGLARDTLVVLSDMDQASVTADQRKLGLRRKSAASRMLRDWSAVTEAIRLWKSVYSDVGRRPPRHSRMELLEFECHYNSAQTFGTIPSSVYGCITATNASSRHRLAAATLAMIAADNHADEATATRVFEAASAIVPESKIERINRLTVEAVFHTSFGNLDLAPAILREIVAEALTISQPTIRATHVRRACFGIARYDDPEYARELLVNSLKTFEELRLWSQAIVCIEDLGAVSIAAGKYDDAMHWIERAREMRPLGNDVFSASIEYELRVMLAFEQMDKRQLPQFALPTDIVEAFLGPVRSRQMHYALKAAESIVAKDIASIHAPLNELRSLHDRLKTCGYQDFSTAVLTAGLIEIGERAVAASIMEAYLKRARRERLALPLALQRVCFQLGMGDGANLPCAATIN
jgi:hypothetical protein